MGLAENGYGVLTTSYGAAEASSCVDETDSVGNEIAGQVDAFRSLCKAGSFILDTEGGSMGL